jgi:hypothetical protein
MRTNELVITKADNGKIIILTQEEYKQKKKHLYKNQFIVIIIQPNATKKRQTPKEYVNIIQKEKYGNTQA